MSKRTLLRAVAALSVPLLGAALASTAAAAPKPKPVVTASPVEYVALGDSYAAGVGAGSYLDSCYRSLKGYPGLIAAAGGYTLDFQACSGATVNDVQTKQLGPLDDETDLVTITVGGNDIGFAATLTTCLGLNTTACLNAVAVANTKINTELPGKLDTLFGAVKGQAPNARVVVTAYPKLFNGKDCSILTSFTSAEMTALNNGALNLATKVSEAAARADFAYADVVPPFVGHAVCDRSPWIRNAQLFNQFESFHPNATGYLSGYKPVVTAKLATAATGGSMTVTTGGITSSDTSRGTVRTLG
nr:SGNH/GDSL hydrolase family protein [Propionibacterium sp.]